MRRRSKWLLLSLAVFAAAFATFKPPEGGDVVEATASAGPSLDSRAAAAGALGMPAQLPQRPGIGEARSEPFTVHSWEPPPPSPAPEQPAAPSAPPNPYRFAGTAHYGGSLKILLARGDALVEVKEGESLDDVYQVRSATPAGVTLVYAPLGIEQQIPGLYAPDSASAGSSASPPQLPPGSPLAPPR